MKANRPVSALARREHLASAAGNVRLRTKLVATAHQQADCSSGIRGMSDEKGRTLAWPECCSMRKQPSREIAV